jgi:predicted nucleotidyltransferase
VRIFGSRANGTSKRASDIDLAIDAPDATISEWSALCEALDEAPLIYLIDIVRRDKALSSKLNSKIEREGTKIYPL